MLASARLGNFQTALVSPDVLDRHSCSLNVEPAERPASRRSGAENFVYATFLHTGGHIAFAGGSTFD